MLFFLFIGVISYILYIRWTDKKLLSLLSSMMVNLDPDYLINISGIIVLKNQISFEDYKKLLLEKFTTLKEFTHRVERPYYFGFPRFQEHLLKPEEHIINIPNTEKPITKEELEKMIAKISKQSLDPSKPLWESYLIDNYLLNENQKSSVVYIRFHHCLADGSSSLLLLLYLLSEKSVKKELGIPQKRKEKPKSNGIIHSVKDIFTSSKNLLFPVDDTHNIFMNVPKEEHPNINLSFYNNIFDVEELKKISHSYNHSTINDLLISGISGSLRKYIEKYSTKEESQLFEKNPIFKGGMWVNMRKMNWFDSKPTEKPVLENNLGSMMFPLQMDKDPSVRILKVSEQIKKLLGTVEPLLCKLMFTLFGFLPPLLMIPLWRFLVSKLNLSISNVPGPQYPLEMCGSEIDSLSFFVNPGMRVGLMICVVSYYGKISSTVCSFDHVNPNEINNLLVQDIMELKK